MVIGAGFDCNPMIFTKDDSGLWYVLWAVCSYFHLNSHFKSVRQQIREIWQCFPKACR